MIKEKYYEYIPKKLTQSFLDKLPLLYEKLIEENSKCNLTRITSQNNFIIRHIIDSLLIYHVIPDFKDQSVIDIGCGGGFPSLVLAMSSPNAHIYAVDSVKKKIAAVERIAEYCGLTNLYCQAENAKQLIQQASYVKSFDILTARAVGTADRVLEMCHRFIGPTGKIILYKTPQGIDKEYEKLSIVAKRFNFKISFSSRYFLPDDSPRQFLILEKK